MAKRIDSSQAAAVYERRNGRCWWLDAWAGVLTASVAEAAFRAVTRADQARRASAGLPLRKGVSPTPDWLDAALVHAAWLRCLPGAPSAFVASTPTDQLRPWIDGDSPLPDVRLLDSDRVRDAADAVHAPRARPSLQVFYWSVKMVLLSRTGRAPTASQVALLAGAAGLESFDALTKASKLWGDRIRVWEKQALFPELEAQFRGLSSAALDAIAPRQ